MNSSEVKTRIKILRKESEDKKHERKVLATDYDKQKNMVKRSATTALLAFLIHYVILSPVMYNQRHATIAGMARFLSPFFMFIFFGSFIYFMIKGFDFFVNTDTKYSKKLAEKLNIIPVAEELRIMNDTITMLDVEIDKLENELYESGEDFSDINDKQEVKITAGEVVERQIVSRTVIEKPVINEISQEKIKPVISDKTQENQKLNTKNKKSDIDDLLNSLDDFSLGEDEDELESSSEMWEKDAMRRFSRY